MKNDSRGGWISIWVLVPFIVLWGFGCGTDGASGGALLEGDPASPAIEAVKDFDSGDRISEDEVSEASNGAQVVRTKIEIEFSMDATVGEVNAVLESNEALITSMLEGLNFIVVRVPDPGSLEALDALVLQMQTDPQVVRVDKSYRPVRDELPDNYSVEEPSDLHYIDHHLAVRAHAAWNAKAALKNDFAEPPVLIVEDYFGDGAPNADFDVKTGPGLFGTSEPDDHGYHVLGIMSARHGGEGGEGSDRGLATGIYPGTLDLYGIDQTWLDRETSENFVVDQIKKSNRNVVVNTSLSALCDVTLAECIVDGARDWIKKLRGPALYATGKTGPASLENKFLHFVSAGNIDGPGPPEVELNSPQSAARLMENLETESGTPLDSLNNTLVIENRDNSIEQPYEAGCIAPTSKQPGDLSAIGTRVWSLTGASSGAGNLTGTSMASPQAAGLAAYVWALAPGLTPQEVLSLLTETARDNACSGGGASAKPVIDAYSAVLAVDHDSALSGGGTPEAPVRLAILDVVDDKGDPGGDGAFDEKDIEQFVREYSATEGELDYSRYDLNGDGWTDGRCDRTEKFNLDIDYPPSYGSVTQDIQSKAVAFDEEKATDVHVLCYYAYSPLYTGDASLRDSALGSRCGECGGDDPSTPWPVPPELIRRQDGAGGLVDLGSSLSTLYSTKRCSTSQISFGDRETSTLTSGCLTSTQGEVLDEITTTDVEPHFVGPFVASWSFEWTTDLIESSGTVTSASQASVDLTETELVMAGSLTAFATASSTESQGLQAVGDASAQLQVQFQIPAALYELTWDCNLSYVQLNRGTTLIVSEGEAAPTWKVESCEGASGSLPAGEYSFKVNARAQSSSAGGSVPVPQSRGGSFRLVLSPPPP